MNLPHPKDIRIELRQLGYFAAITECGSITTAASKLGVAQPSLSQVVSRLETELGVTLFLRTGKGIELTEAGHALAGYARDIVLDVDNKLNAIRQLGGNKSGRVSLGLPPMMASLLGVSLAETIKCEYPDIQLTMLEALSANVLEEILEERLDVGICYQGNDYSNCDTTFLFEEPLFLFSAADNWPDPERDSRNIAAKPIDFQEIATLPLVLPNRKNGLRNHLERIAKSQNIEFNVNYELDSLQNIISMTTRASAYTILPQAAAVKEIESGEIILIPIVNPTLTHKAYLTRKRGRPVSAANQAVGDVISAILKETIERHHLLGELAR
ncbi:MAG: LysR family transcriptional regulator [Sphingobium sp.]